MREILEFIFPSGEKFGVLQYTIILLVCFAVIFSVYSQRKNEAKRKRLTVSAKKGDTIITFGGIVGTLHEIISEKEVSLKIAENVYIRVVRGAIANVLKSGTDLEKMSNPDINLYINLAGAPWKDFFSEAMITHAQEGDKIITFGGIVGTLHKFINKKEILLKVSENTYIRVLESAISCAFKNKTDLGKINVFKLGFFPFLEKRTFITKSFLVSLSSFFDEQGGKSL
jgi:preprotein translocase subunit YajC